MKRLRSSRGGVDAPPRPGLVLPGRELDGPDAWPRLFGRRAPLVVEVGFGKDPFLLDRAARHPEQDHVGVERDLGRCERFLEKAAARGLTNVRALPVAAEIALGACFPVGGVADLHVYFPDPWPKDRHAWNRMIRPWFGQAARRVLAAGAHAYLATDDPTNADAMREALSGAGFELLEEGRDGTGHATKFERLWRARGRTIHSFLFRAPGAAV